MKRDQGRRKTITKVISMLKKKMEKMKKILEKCYLKEFR